MPMKTIFIFAFILICKICISQVPKIKLITFAQGLTKPLDIKNCGDSRLFVVEQAGRIRIVNNNGNLISTPFLNISSKVNSTGNEQGLLSMAFSPNFKTDGYFFVNYITGSGNGSSVLARYSVNPNDSNIADANSEKILLQFAQPYTNHNGSDLRFGPDGYLYVSFGDGGSGGDPQNNGQNTNTYFGKILRINPFKGTLYEIPNSNPFYGQTDKKQEIWAYGLRNPWRCSFDRLTGDYWIADVGQGNYEEINFQSASSFGGQNYGWRCYEANTPYNSTGCNANQESYIFPVYFYSHSASNGCSVTGGYIYRGAQYRNMFGKYFFGDYCSGRIWCTEKTGSSFNTTVLNNYLPYQFSSFGENNMGELFLTGLANGNIYRLADTSSCEPVAFLSNKDTIYACGNTELLRTPPGTDLTFSWSFNHENIVNANRNDYMATQNGKYIVKVTNSLLCSATDSVVLLLNNGTKVNITNLESAYCTNSNAIDLEATPPGGVFTINDNQATARFDPMELGTGSYTVKYTYTNSAGCTDTTSVHVTVSICTGLSRANDLNFRVSVIPNPGKGLFNRKLNSPKSQRIIIQVLDLRGRKYFGTDLSVSAGTQTIPLNLENFASGTYLIKINGTENKEVLKVLIQK